MSRRQRSWWAGITPQGLFVVGTASLTTITLTGTACWLFLHGESDAGQQLLTASGFAAMGTGGLAARLRPDPAATVDQPASVTAVPEGGPPE
jgi:hypothetical protein